MGRNAQKRRARRARQANAPRKKGAGVDEEPAPPPSEEELARLRRRPPWLQPSMLAPPGERPPDDDDTALLQVAAGVAQGLTLHQLAALIAEVLDVDAVLLGRASSPDDLKPVGEHRNTLKAPQSQLAPLLTRDLLADALGSSMPMVLPDVSRDPRIPPVQSSRTGSLAVVALNGVDGPWGVLAAGRREVGALYDRDVERLALLGAELGADLAQSEAIRVGFTDPGTGLLSRQAALMLLFRELERARRRERPLALVLLRPDGLEAASAAEDDHRLQDLAVRAEAAARGAELVARYDRRTLLFVLDASEEAAVEGCERLLRDLSASGEGEGVTLSAGVAAPRPEEEPLQLLARAQQALATALEAGGARIARSPLEPEEEPEVAGDEVEPGSD